MIIKLYGAYIDPTSKNILVPSALEAYLTNSVNASATVPDFCPTDEFTIPINTGTNAYSYASITWGDITRYYFLTVTESPDQYSGVFNYRFSIDWAHTLRCGSLDRKFRERSVVTRSTAVALEAYEQDRSSLKSIECVSDVASSGYRIVGIYAVKRASGDLSVFSEPTYQYMGVVSNALAFGVGAVADFVNAMYFVYQMMRVTSFVQYNASGVQVATDKCSPVAFYILPAAYGVDHTPTNMTLRDSGDQEVARVWYPGEDVETVSKTFRMPLDRKYYAYEFGSNSKRVAWRSAPVAGEDAAEIHTTFILSGSPGEFSITANIDGNVIDLTDACSVPFVISNESEINVQVNRRNLSLISSGVQIVGGIATQNAAMLYSGAMSAASSVADVGSTSFPTITGSGNLYSESVTTFGGDLTVDILKMFRYDLTQNARYKNLQFGMVGAKEINAFPQTAFIRVYLEGDLFPIPENYLEAQNLSRMKQIYDNGIRVYKAYADYLS